METVAVAFPELASELVAALNAAGQIDLAGELLRATVREVTFDNSANAGYIYVNSPKSLNLVEQNIIGVRHGETIPVECRYWINLDTDNFGRLAGIEILSPPADLQTELSGRARRTV